jgi:hypothetical protein
MSDICCQRLRFRASSLEVLVGEDVIQEEFSTPDSGKVVRLFGEGTLEREDGFARIEVGQARLSAYCGDSVKAWAKGGILKNHDLYTVVINADQAFGPAFPLILTAIIQRPAEWKFALNVAAGADLTAADFHRTPLVGASAHWHSPPLA